jgi:hypothetical protein
MDAPDSVLALRVLREATGLARLVGVEREATALQVICDRLQKESLTYELLRGEVDDAMSQASARISESILDDMGDPRPGQEALADEHERIWAEFLKVIYPPEWTEMDVSEFRGAKHLNEAKVSFKGDAGGVRHVVEGSIALIRKYSELIAAEDFPGAYRLTDAGLQRWMSAKKFAAEHEGAAKRYGGAALEFVLNQFAYIYADEAARKASNTSKEGWPTLTAKENRRCRVIGFWIRDRAAMTGCAGSLWIAQEGGEYRVAKFNFYTP